jgi:hypothetical protein
MNKVFILYYRPALALFGALSIAMTARAQTSSYYGLTYFDNQLIKIDGATGTGTLIGTLDQNVNGYGLATSGTGLYTFNPNNDEIQRIDPATATVAQTYSIGVSNTLGEGDLAFSSNGAGFLASSLNADFTPANDLFRFDVTTGTSTLLAHTSVTLNGLAFVGNTLFGLSKDENPDLYIVDQSTGDLSLVGSLGIDAGSPIAALAANGQGGLVGVINDRLYNIDSATGAASVVSEDVLDTNFASVSGLTAIPASPVPEPSTYGILGALGLAGLVTARSLKRKTR